MTKEIRMTSARKTARNPCRAFFPTSSFVLLSTFGFRALKLVSLSFNDLYLRPLLSHVCQFSDADMTSRNGQLANCRCRLQQLSHSDVSYRCARQIDRFQGRRALKQQQRAVGYQRVFQRDPHGSSNAFPKVTN